MASFTLSDVLLLSPQSITIFAFMHVFDSITSNIYGAFLINPSGDVFAFGDFNVHSKDCLSYSGGTDRPGELCYNFTFSNTRYSDG